MNERKKFHYLWDELKTDPEFLDSLKYQDIPIFDLLCNEFTQMFEYDYPGFVLNIEIIKRVIHVESPDLLLTESEYSSFGLAAIVKCRENSIPTLALQHGIPLPGDISYNHPTGEVSKESTISPNKYPIADLTFVFGEHTKELLINEGNFPQTAIVITGAPKYDRISEVKKSVNKEELRKTLNIPKSDKILLFGMGFFWDKIIREAHLKIIVKELKKLNNITLIIKLHPLDQIEEYEMILDQTGAKNVRLIKDVPILELINICNIFMMEFTTIGFEALIFEKPVLSIQIHKRSRVDIKDKYNSIIIIEKIDELIPCLMNIFNNIENYEAIPQEIINGAQYYILADGNAVKRIVNIIEEKLSKK